MSAPAHCVPLATLLADSGVDAGRGLDPEEARRRLESDGPNSLRREEVDSPFRIFLRQFNSLVVLVLIGAAVVSLLLGEVVDGVAILSIVLLNSVIGFVQEWRAEQAIAALARLAAPQAKVVRRGRPTTVPASAIVRGDLLLLEPGDLVAADARLIEASALRTNEAPLTGESESVEKCCGELPPETPLAERRNMVFLGTSVVGGCARALVVSTGMATEVGKIAGLLQTASHDSTPLQSRLDEVARRLLWASAGVVLLVFALGLARKLPLTDLFLTSVSLAVAAIPEGLPAVVTVSLALGVSRMVRRNALVRRLASVETLGSASVICTDKTGTLTVGQMTARRLATMDRVYSVTGEGYRPEGEILSDGPGWERETDGCLRELLTALAGCVDAGIEDRDGLRTAVGDPTEAALVVLAGKADVIRDRIEQEMPRCGSVPFDSDRKRMTILRQREGATWAFVKGAPEVLLHRCVKALSASGPVALDEGLRGRLLEAAALMANDALRVLAVAERRLPEDGVEDVETELTLLGLVGLQDPPRAEASDAVLRCRRAGIRTVMITGDHPETARAIGRELGILQHGDAVMVGREVELLGDAELAERVESIRVYARVTAEHKLRIVRAWKARGAVVAMTGDGVNDAPALREASIGIAMGISGTEVTKEAADMVITDDNFASIVAAVEEGRGIYDNIAKTIGYLLAGNAGELAIMLVAVLLGWPMPLLPIQLLWINLITDGLPALALATDPIDRDVLQRPPRPSQSRLIDRALLGRAAFTAVLTASVALFGFGWEMAHSGRVADARNAAFSILTFDELLRSFSSRSASRTIWQVGLFSNLRLFVIVAVSFLLQLVIHHTPALEKIFGTEPIRLSQSFFWIGLGVIPLAVLELLKLVRRPGQRAS